MIMEKMGVLVDISICRDLANRGSGFELTVIVRLLDVHGREVLSIFRWIDFSRLGRELMVTSLSTRRLWLSDVM